MRELLSRINVLTQEKFRELNYYEIYRAEEFKIGKKSVIYKDVEHINIPIDNGDNGYYYMFGDTEIYQVYYKLGGRMLNNPIKVDASLTVDEITKENKKEIEERIEKEIKRIKEMTEVRLDIK